MAAQLSATFGHGSVLYDDLSFLVSPVTRNLSALTAINYGGWSRTWKAKFWNLFDKFGNGISHHFFAKSFCLRKGLTSSNRKIVSILIGGKRLDAVEDTGSTKSCIDLALAQQLGLDITYTSDVQEKFRLPNDSISIPVGETLAECILIRVGNEIWFIGKFYVFSRLQVPVILGNDLTDSPAEDPGPPREKPRAAPTVLLSFPPSQLAKPPVRFHGLVDTGAEMNLISESLARDLCLKIAEYDETLEFCMVNGGIIKSSGRVKLTFSVINGTGPNLHFEQWFYVIKDLHAPTVLGEWFIQGLDLFGKNRYLLSQERYSGGNVTEEVIDDPLVTHLHQKDHPLTRRFRSIINDQLVLANADTGSQLNLASPSLAARLCDTAQPLKKENLDIKLADQSKAHIKASFETSFSPQSSPQEIIAVKFYVLDGLISEALIGYDLLDRIGAFTRNRDSFLDLADRKAFHELGLITNSGGRWSKLFETLRIWHRTNGSNDGTSIPTLQTLPEASRPDYEFYSALAYADARETNRRTIAKQEIARLTGRQKLIARDAEKMKIDRYETEKSQRIAERPPPPPRLSA